MHCISNSSLSFILWASRHTLLYYYAGTHSICLPRQQTSYCINFTRVPVVIWPQRSSSADGYCYCLARPHVFPSCSTRCTSIYQFVLEGGSICLVQMTGGTLVPGIDELKVYFVFDANPCHPSYPCLVSSITDLYRITQQGNL